MNTWTCNKCGHEIAIAENHMFCDLSEIESHVDTCNDNTYDDQYECSFCGSECKKLHVSNATSPNGDINTLCDICYHTIPSSFLAGMASGDTLEIARIIAGVGNFIVNAARALEDSQ